MQISFISEGRIRDDTIDDNFYYSCVYDQLNEKDDIRGMGTIINNKSENIHQTATNCKNRIKNAVLHHILQESRR
jgi:hypothetical protein